MTRQGGLVAAGSIVLVVAGRLFGIFELFLVGAGGAALVIAAVVVVGVTRLRLDVARELRPPRVHAGAQSTVALRVHNAGKRRSPLLHLRDAVGAQGRSASVLLGPLRPGVAATASYSLPTERRGILPVGPLELRIGDPFGLASTGVTAAPVTELTVWPTVDDVLPLPPVTGDDLHDGVGVAIAHSTTVEDFYALRSYTDGDDLRRVHWRATAKRDDLVVRQDEMPRRSRATVVLDTRSEVHRAETFERAVSGAASVVVACARHGVLVRLVTPAGYDSGFGCDAEHVETVMDHLATVQVADGQRLGNVLADLDRPGSRGSVTVMSGAGVNDGRRHPDLAATATDRATVVVFSHQADPPSSGVQRSVARGLMVVGHRTSFAATWNRAWASAKGTAEAPATADAHHRPRGPGAPVRRG